MVAPWSAALAALAAVRNELDKLERMLPEDHDGAD
jgi:hypothetical protein